MATKEKNLEVELKKELPGMVTLAKFEIVDAGTMKNATELLSTLNQRLDAITEEKEKVTKPLNAALTAERGRWKPFESKLEEAIKSIRAAMTTYQTAEKRKAEAEAAKIAARIGEGKGHLKLETAAKKMEEIEKPDEQISTDAGIVKFRTDKKLKITDYAKIPRKYLVEDEKLIMIDLKAGIVVPGCEIEEIQTPINFR